jgi:hypothetical protein
MPRPTGPPPPLTLYGLWDACARLGDPDALVPQIELLEQSVEAAPGIALDTSKSIIESVCKTVLDARGITYDKEPDVHALVKLALGAVRITGDGLPEELAKSMRGLGSGMVRVAQHLAELRNTGGLIGHGRGAQERFIGKAQALYAARAADALVHLIITAHVEEPSPTPPVPLYGDHTAFDQWTDEVHEPVAIYASTYQASEILFRVDPIGYEEQREVFETERPALDAYDPEMPGSSPLGELATVVAYVASGVHTPPSGGTSPST